MDMAWRQSQNYLNHQNHCSGLQSLDIICVRHDQKRKYATVTALVPSVFWYGQRQLWRGAVRWPAVTRGQQLHLLPLANTSPAPAPTRYIYNIYNIYTIYNHIYCLVSNVFQRDVLSCGYIMLEFVTHYDIIQQLQQQQPLPYVPAMISPVF